MGEKYTVSKKVCDYRIKNIYIYKETFGRTLLIFTDRQIIAYSIETGQKSLDIEGHTDTVLKINCLEISRLKDIAP